MDRACVAMAFNGPGSDEQKSARRAEHSLPELPHAIGMETDSRRARIRSQQDFIPIARHASECSVRAVPYETSVLKCRNEVR